MRRFARVAVGALVRQDNRTKYKVYALDDTKLHDAFLNRLFRRMPARGATRDEIRRYVLEEGRGKYKVFYNEIVLDVEGLRRRLSFTR